MEKEVRPSDFIGWWLRRRRESMGVDRALLARRSAARGARRVTRTLLIDLELGRRLPNFRTLPQLAFSLEMPAEILAALVVASQAVACDLEMSVLVGSAPPEEAAVLARARAALLGGRFGRAFALAELAGDEELGGPGEDAARLVAAGAALGLAAPALARWRAGAVLEEGRSEALRSSAALVFARAAWSQRQVRRTCTWLAQALALEAPLDRAWRGILEGELAMREGRYSRARTLLMDAHEAALLAGSAWVAAMAGRDLADTLDRMNRPDLARGWRRRHATWGAEGQPFTPPHDRKTFG